jgi:hypothetical protein
VSIFRCEGFPDQMGIISQSSTSSAGAIIRVRNLTMCLAWIRRSREMRLDTTAKDNDCVRLSLWKLEIHSELALGG